MFLSPAGAGLQAFVFVNGLLEAQPKSFYKGCHLLGRASQILPPLYSSRTARRHFEILPRQDENKYIFVRDEAICSSSQAGLRTSLRVLPFSTASAHGKITRLLLAWLPLAQVPAFPERNHQRLYRAFTFEKSPRSVFMLVAACSVAVFVPRRVSFSFAATSVCKQRVAAVGASRPGKSIGSVLSRFMDFSSSSAPSQTDGRGLRVLASGCLKAQKNLAQCCTSVSALSGRTARARMPAGSFLEIKP